MFDLDVVSVCVGYVAGVFLTWSICRTIYDVDESTGNTDQLGIYGWCRSDDAPNRVIGD